MNIQSLTLKKEAGTQTSVENGDCVFECVQNHGPHVMVIDEIGRLREVDAALTVKHRGVRLVASAHGNLRTLVKNTALNGLIGGVETVILGDDRVKQKFSHQKEEKKLQRELDELRLRSNIARMAASDSDPSTCALSAV